MSAEVVISADTPHTGTGPWLAPLAIELFETRGVKIRAYGLTAADTLAVKDVRLALSGNATHRATQSCITLCPGGLKIISSMPHQVCGVPIVLTGPSNSVYVKGPGTFLLEFNGPSFAAGTVVVTAEELNSEDITDSMVKCPCPCAPPPVVIPPETDCTLGAKITTAGSVNFARVVSKTAAGCLQEGPLVIPPGFTAIDCSGAPLPQAGAALPLCSQLPVVLPGTNITSVVPTVVGAGPTQHTVFTVNAPDLCALIKALATANTRAHRCDDLFAVLGADGQCAMVKLPVYRNGSPISCNVISNTDLAIVKTISATSFTL